MALQLRARSEIDDLIRHLDEMTVGSSLYSYASDPPENKSYESPSLQELDDEFWEDVGGLKYLQSNARNLVKVVIASHYISTATPGVYILACRVEGLPKLTWELLRLSTIQMIEEILEPFFNLSLQDESRATLDKLKLMHEWDFMSYDATESAIEKMVRLWALALGMIGEKLGAFQEAMPKTRSQFQTRLLWLFNNFWEELSEQTDPRQVPIVSLVEGVVLLVSDLGHALEYPTPALQHLHRLPSRHRVLADIVSKAPTEDGLYEHISMVFAELPDDDHICHICSNSWDDLEHDEAFAHRSGVQSWCAVSKDMEHILILPGYERVPMKLCEHVMCIGCVKTWLDNFGHRQCPWRDQDYGIVRCKAVREMEDLVSNCDSNWRNRKEYTYRADMVPSAH